jgi:hypothetical protein
MRIYVPVIIAVSLIAALAVGARAAARSRITTFTLSPAESLAPHPRTSVETVALPAPADPEPVVVAASPLSRDELLGRWTERDPAYCQEERYVLEWTRDRMRILLDGRPIDSGGVRYVTDSDALKVERLTDTGAVAGYWRLAAVDGDHVKWLETAEQHGGAATVIAKPDKLLVRCATDAEPAPGFAQRAKRWWSALLGL